MTITHHPEDKFAFLFSGPALPRFMKDLENVYAVLTQYYNYPAANVRVVLGSTPASAPSFAYTTIASIAALQTEVDDFASAASGAVADGHKSALLYFTGGGAKIGGAARLLIDDSIAATLTNSVDDAWLTTRMAGFPLTHVNVVMQQSYGGAFSAMVAGLAVPGCSFTAAGTADESTPGNDIDGSFFTASWCKALRYETLGGTYADAMGAGTEATDHLLSMTEALTFGKQEHDAAGYGVFATPFSTSDGGPQYLGVPHLIVRDGQAPLPWRESPDVYLTYPNHPTLPASDLYIPDLPGATPPYNNTINVTVRNVGTHPVRRYSLGIELFKTPSGGASDQHPISDRVPSGAIGGVLLPIPMSAIGTAADRYDVADWNTAFTLGTTHECIKAEAKLVAGDVDFAWDIVPRDFEAQRNTDEMALAMMPATATPVGGIQGQREHRYAIHNRFQQPRRYAIVFPADYDQRIAGYQLEWLEDRDGVLEPAEIVPRPRPCILLTIEPRGTRNLVLRVRTARDAKPRKDEVRLAFAIAVEGEWKANFRAAGFNVAETVEVAAPRPAFAEIAGFTVVLRQGSSTLKGQIVDRNGRPAPGATVIVQTVDGLQRVAVKTDAKGRYELANVNPDVYVVRTETEHLRSKDRTVVLGASRVEIADLGLTRDITPPAKHVKVILDRIQIRKDWEPAIKGRADLSFTTEIVPDLDEKQKQVTRLPKRGLVHASDKPGANDIQFGTTLFDGFVTRNTLTIKIAGKEQDLFDPDDRLKTYERAFSGDPETWLGTYQPADEHVDPEDVGDWSVWYRIVSV